MTRPISNSPVLTVLLRRLFVPACVASLLSLPSALASSQPRLEPIGYREALNWFHSQKYDNSGAWICGYSLAREDYSVAPKAPRLLVEVAERFLYLKTGGQLVELTGAVQSPQRSEYQNPGAGIRITLDILKRNNFSEYQESHDRQVLARIEINDQVETLRLKGQSCGT
ncbi:MULTISPECIES: hypothetical protein [Pseudomonas]|uniref:hypothetical protein n=1 Tax=Pseudomonas TaxID=286 RepID=UPI000838FE4C|nr:MULTISPECIES: hypothetical protein [Pseudomonas]AZC25228.1 hypothetical protein C4K39_3560 [Pseudomonas sessilinigenes]